MDEVGGVERGPRARLHARGEAGDACDGVDRVPEQVTVMEPIALAERPHGLARDAAADAELLGHRLLPLGPDPFVVVGGPAVLDQNDGVIGQRLLLASIKDLELGGLLPDIKVNTSATDFAPISQMQLIKFKGETWERFGEILSGDVGG